MPNPEENRAFHDVAEWTFDLDDERLPVFAEVLGTVQRFKPSGRLLDVGCGSGGLVARAASRGYDAVGIELSQDACRVARERHGVDVACGTVRDRAYDDGASDVIVAMEVIDYPADPIAELREYRRILADDGVLVITVRSNRWSTVFGACNAVHRMFRRRPMRIGRSAVSRFLNAWGTFTANYQLTTRSLLRVLAQAGWEPARVQNQRTGWDIGGARPALFAAYRFGCNVLERLTGGACVIGPKILVVAKPTSSKVTGPGLRPDAAPIPSTDGREAAHATSGGPLSPRA